MTHEFLLLYCTVKVMAAVGLRPPVGAHGTEDSVAARRTKLQDASIDWPDSIGALVHLTVLLEDQSVVQLPISHRGL